MHVSRGRGSVLLRRRCHTLRTSGFADDVMFADSRPVGRGDANSSRDLVILMTDTWRVIRCILIIIIVEHGRSVPSLMYAKNGKVSAIN